MTTFDNHADLAYSLVVTAPSPATTGTTLTLTAGQGALMPTPPFNAVAWPANVQPLASNAEIVRVTAMTGDTVTTMTRAQEGTSAVSIATGYQFAAAITKKLFTDIETAIAALAPLASPAFTGTPTAPTATAGTNTTQLATTAFVAAAVTAGSAGVASFNTRTGAVTLTKADVTGTGLAAADVGADASGAATAVKGLPLGLTGATATTRYVGATASGAPASGTFALGDFVVDQTGKMWVCTVAGTPGTWAQPTIALDTTATDIQPLGTQAAGATGKAADAGHVHTMPRLDQVSAPTAAVALNAQKITGLANGVLSTDAAALGQLPAASSTTPAMDSTAAVGTSATYARADHVHPSDTSRADVTALLAGVPPVAAITTSAALAVNKFTPADATSGALAPTLPTPTQVGQVVGLEKIDSTANTVSVTGTFRGASSTISLALQNESVLFVCEQVTPSVSWRPYAGHKTLASLDSRYLQKSSSLSDLASAVAARSNLGLGATPATAGKQVVFPIGADTSGTGTGFTGALQRWLLAFPAAPTSMRLRIANTGQAGALTLDDIYVGSPTYSSGTWNGGIAASPTKVLTAPTMASDGSETVTSWFDPTALWSAADKAMVLSIDFACLASINVQKSSQMGYCRYRTTGSGLSGEVAATAPASGSLSNTTAMLDIRLEVQFSTNLRVVLVLGDSTTIGYNDTGDAPNAPGPMCAWPWQMMMKTRCLAINAGVGGKATSDYTSAADAKYTRVLSTAGGSTPTVPDDILINLGINDANSGVAAATFKTNLQSVITAAKSLSSTSARVWVATVLQQPRFKDGVLLAGCAAGATTLQTSYAYANGDVLDLDYEGSYGTKDAGVTVSGASTGTSAPYTTTLTAGTGHAHSQGAPINQASTGSRRLDYNQHIRKLPPQVDGVFLIDAETGAPGAPNVADPRFWYGGATIHPGVNCYAAIAGAITLPAF